MSVIPHWRMLAEELISPALAHVWEPLAEPLTVRLGVICHAYNITSELLQWLLHVIDSCSPSAIVFTTNTQAKRDELETFLASLPGCPQFAKILVVDNLGRDVVPFWTALEVLSPHADVFLKLHWKHSPHLDQYFPKPNQGTVADACNNDIYRSLVPANISELREILLYFQNRRTVCMYPRPWPQLGSCHWMMLSNMKHVSRMLKDLSCPQSALLIPLIFPCGNMFYGSTSFFSSFLPYFLTLTDYPAEPLPTDGTALHAIERVYTLLAASRGFDIAALFPSSFSSSPHDDLSTSPLGRKIVLFPVADLLASCWPAATHQNTSPASLPMIYHQQVTLAVHRSLLAQREYLQKIDVLRRRDVVRRLFSWVIRRLPRSPLSISQHP